jgi:superfamily II DNA or RNA helicase
MNDKTATVTYLGRVLSVEPAYLGQLFEDDLSITLIEQGEPDPRNNWQRQMIQKPQRTFWYDTDPHGVAKFFSYAGYGPRILKKLRAQGFEVVERDWLPSGLPAPRFDLLPKDLQWRGSQAQVMATMLASRCGTVVCPTGWGKTSISRLIPRIYPDSSIIFTVPSRDVARDLHEALSLDGPVGFCGDGTHDPQRVTVAITHSLKHCHRQANLLIGDEAHALVAESFREALVQFPRAKFLGMTASPSGRSDGGDQYIEAIFGPVIYEVPYQEAVESGNVVPIDVWVMQVPTGPNVQSIVRKDLKDRAGIWSNAYRNARVVEAVDLVTKRFAPGDPQILIMVDKIEHAYRLQQVLPDFTVVSGTSTDENIDRLVDRGVLTPGQKLCSRKDRDRYKAEFEAGTLRRAIATFIWSKGVDFVDLDVLIRADGTSSPIHSTQVPGRVSRLGHAGQKVRGVLVDFNDSFSPDLAARSKMRFKVYRQNGFKIEAIT